MHMQWICKLCKIYKSDQGCETAQRYVKLRQITLKRCTSNGYANDVKYAKASKVVKLRNATLNVVKLHNNTLNYTKL